MADRPSSVRLPLNVLNPGASTRRGRRSCCRCLIWTVFIVAAFCTAWISLFVGWSFRQWISNIRSPHKEHYFNATQDPLPDLIVRPLIDENQTFDIAVSVWLRATEEEEAAYRRNRTADVVIGDKGEGIPTKIDVTTGVGDANDTIEDPQEERKDILETPLFSDIVFQGLRLKDKGIAQKVQFRLPTARFIGSNVSYMDLRGSFVLIPTSPSLLNYLKNYSNWLPETLNIYPRRSWPFPLGSTSQSERTLVDEAVELFGFSVPLLQFHEVQSRCLNLNSSLDNITDTTALADATFHAVKESDYDTSTGLDKKDEDAADESSANASMSQLSKIHKRHPYVVTRTQLRIVDQTALFNRNAYNKAHNKLKMHACGSGMPNVKPSWKRCTRNYKKNGHWETRLELEMPTPGNDSDVRTEWSYGPYLDSYKNAVGPQDLVAVPVTRENCTIATNRTTPAVVFPKQDEEFVDITWHLSFSGRSPAKMAIADSIDVDFSSVGHNQSEYENVMAQDKAELFNGIAGHRFYDDSHPRRRVALAIMGSILGFIKFFITGHYWYTLTSTFSISISGTMLLVLADFADVGIQALMTVQESMTTGFWMNTFVYFSVLIAVITLLPQFAMIKAVMRLECVVDSGWFPRLRRIPANHKERASERLDGRTSKTFRLALFTCLVVIYYFFRPHEHFAIPARTPPPAVEDFPTHKLRDLSPSVLIPLRLTALIQQMLLNHRTRTFAGQHKLSVVISCIEWSLGSAIFIPAIVGRVRARQGLSSHDIIDTVALIVGVWQALTLTSVTQTQGHEEED